MKHSHRNKRLFAIALPLVLLFGASVASAADVDVSPRAWVPKPPPNAYSHGPAVYGWSYRARGERAGMPSTIWNGCGVYRYWNGAACVDARDVPPAY
jgi:hypothetical protein